MPRVAKKKQNLRGSVTQNVQRDRDETAHPPWFSFGLRLGLLVGAAVAIIGTAAWMWHSGWPRAQEQYLGQIALDATQKAHFVVKDIAIEGRLRTEKEDLFTALGVHAGSPLFGFDPHTAQTRILALPWVATATVERHLPDRIFVRLTEREPLARWQQAGRTVVIDRTGAELKAARPEDYATLPLLAGPDAPQKADAFLADMNNHPELLRIMKAAARVGERRWDIYLQPNLLVRLPEKGMPVALARLEMLIRDKNILQTPIAAVDLRIPDRITMEPHEPAAGAAPKPTGEQRK